jgi:hypothetical protein
MSEVEDNFAAIRRETFERYLLDCLREAAYEEERLRFLEEGKPFPREIRRIDFLEEAYVVTGFRIRFFNHVKGVEEEDRVALYGNPDLSRDGELLSDAYEIVSDILMRARGG